MKRLISTLVLVFAFVLGANAQSNKAEQKSNAAQAEITFEKLEHDYGKVEQMPQLEGKRMIMFIAPRKGTGRKPVIESTASLPTEPEPKQKKAPQQKAPKEYTGPKVEGEDFDL